MSVIQLAVSTLVFPLRWFQGVLTQEGGNLLRWAISPLHG